MKYLLSFLLFFALNGQIAATDFHFEMPEAPAQSYSYPLTSSGSTYSPEVAWDILYMSVPQESLKDKLYRRVHRYYANTLKNWNLWTWGENEFLNQIKAKNVQIPHTPVDEEEAWDILYRNVEATDLRFLIRQSSHKEYVESKGWEIIESSELQYIQTIKNKITPDDGGDSL